MTTKQPEGSESGEEIEFPSELLGDSGPDEPIMGANVPSRKGKEKKAAGVTKSPKLSRSKSVRSSEAPKAKGANAVVVLSD